jgi:hypothetical protein
MNKPQANTQRPQQNPAQKSQPTRQTPPSAPNRNPAKK